MTHMFGTDIAAELERVVTHWTPRVVGRVNDQYVVPRGVRHNPVAENEVHIVLIETVTTAHTGDVTVAGSVPIDQQVGDFS